MCVCVCSYVVYKHTYNAHSDFWVLSAQATQII